MSDVILSAEQVAEAQCWHCGTRYSKSRSPEHDIEDLKASHEALRAENAELRKRLQSSITASIDAETSLRSQIAIGDVYVELAAELWTALFPEETPSGRGEELAGRIQRGVDDLRKRLEAAEARSRNNHESALGFQDRALRAEERVSAERTMKEAARTRWSECQDRLMAIEQCLIEITGDACGISDNIQTLREQRDVAQAEAQRLRDELQFACTRLTHWYDGGKCRFDCPACRVRQFLAPSPEPRNTEGR